MSRGRARLLARLATAGSMVVAAAAPVVAQESTTALYAPSGARYAALLGSLEELFPRGSSASIQGVAPALAIDIVQPTGARERLLVPGTDDPQPERRPTLIWDESSSSLFVLWTSGSGGDARLGLATLGADGWTEVTKVTPEAFSVAGPPEVLLVRESDERVVVHLTFAQAGSGAPYYAAVVLYEGRYVGWNPVLPLASFDSASSSAGAPAAARMPPIVDRGSDQRSAVVGFLSADAGRVLSLRSRVLPMALISFADEARNHLIGVGTWHRSAGELATAVASHLAELEAAVHPGARSYLRRQAAAFVGEHVEDYGTLHELADALRRHLIREGASLLNQEFTPEPASCRLIEVGPDLGQQAMPPPHQLEICLITARHLPPVGDGAEIHVSEDGRRLLLAWQAEEDLFFRLSRDSGWSEEKRVHLGSEDPSRVIESLLR